MSFVLSHSSIHACPQVSLQDVSGVPVDVFKAEEKSITHALRLSEGHRKKRNQELKPCWNRPVSSMYQKLNL